MRHLIKKYMVQLLLCLIAIPAFAAPDVEEYIAEYSVKFHFAFWVKDAQLNERIKRDQMPELSDPIPLEVLVQKHALIHELYKISQQEPARVKLIKISDINNPEVQQQGEVHHIEMHFDMTYDPAVQTQLQEMLTAIETALGDDPFVGKSRGAKMMTERLAAILGEVIEQNRASLRHITAVAREAKDGLIDASSDNMDWGLFEALYAAYQKYETVRATDTSFPEAYQEELASHQDNLPEAVLKPISIEFGTGLAHLLLSDVRSQPAQVECIVQ